MSRKTLKIKYYNPKANVIEKKLGIPGDYQFKAIQSNNFLQANWHKNKLKVVEKLLTPNKQMVVLDLGTGSGNFEINTHKKVKKIIGLDHNSLALEFLDSYLDKNKIKNVELIQLDIKKLSSLKIPKVDTIVMIDVIEHLAMSGVKKMIKDMTKLLKPHGKVLVITPNYKSLWSIMEFLFDHALTFLLPKFGECQHLSKFDPQNIQEIFSTGGFKTNTISTFNLVSWLSPSGNTTKLLNYELNSRIKFGNLLAGVFELR